jgi:alkylhydroperoxidase family enzyme
MARVAPVEAESAVPRSRELLAEQVASHGRATNMKRTLAHSPAALFALMRWYDLHAEVKAFLGDRLTTLFAFAISSQTDCLICSTFFRRWLTEAGEDPDRLTLTDRERAVVEFGRQLARDANAVSDDLYARATAGLTDAQAVALTAFGGLMIATNVFNNALRVDLDEYLFPFRKGAAT